MEENRQVNKVLSFLVTLLVMFTASIVPAQALLKGGTWQQLHSATGEVNGTVPRADGAVIPVYQGSVLLDPTQTYDIAFTAMPRDFSADATPTSMRAVNSTDTEGDLFSEPPTIAWENQQPPVMSLVWADAATPDTPLSPQPILNQTFCAQNLAGRQLVAWAQVEDETTVPALWLYTSTGVPNNAIIPLLSPKVTLNIKPAVSDPVSASGDHFDANFEASKVKAGESITLTISTKACNGDVEPNTAFVIHREDAKNRQGEVNNANPVHVGDTELTTTQAEYHGVTDGQGNATVVVTQENGPGVKTRLIVSSAGYPTLTDNVDVIFTTITSPDSDKANMYGHMIESATATLNGTTYTFNRPKLAAETSGNSTVVDTNETWALFTWSGADNHCDILPDAEQLVQLRHEHSTLETWTGWPVSGDAEYWSSTKDQMSNYHAAVHMNSASVIRAANSDTLLVSCVDKAQPAAHPQITLSPQGPYKAQVGESIDLVMTVVDRDTQKPLPYRYMELFIDPAKNRKGEHQDAWDNQRVTINSEDMRASSPEHYTGVTDANGQAHLTLKHDSGMGVETPIRIVMPDDEGGNVELPFSVIFTVITSPDVDGASMWGHMQGVVDAGNLYKRPQLAVEASHKDGQFSENNEEWATFNSVDKATAQCGTGQVPDQSSLEHLYSENASGKMESEHGWPTSDFFIAADNDESGTVHVNLENGNSGKFTNQPNYLTCSANEMVAVLDVYFNDDPVIKNADAKVGEQIKLNVHSRNALNDMTIAYTDFTVTMANGRRRDGLTTGFTDTSNGEMQFDGVGYVAGQVYHGITDANGDATIILTQNKGVGLLTPLSIVPADSYINTPVSRSVKFTVATSPDTPAAKMWGHMADTITVGDLTFERPKLADEVTPVRTQDEANETWARVLHPDAAGNPDAGGCAASRLPRIDQLEALYSANSGGAMKSTQGWPTLLNYWSSTFQSASTWKLISLFSGSEFANGNVSIYSSCLASDNPVAAAITIEPVDASQWYDGSGVHAVKVKKGDTMRLKVTVKDASGNPIPEAPFVLTRGDGYTRQGEKHSSREGDDPEQLVTPVVIDGESLAWSSTKMGMQVGTDGTRIINVTRPDTNGTLTALIATLYENATVSASIDTIFTVVTSPDVDVAHMWGHMLPSLTAADGAVYQRPLLYNELSSTTNISLFTEDNEVWAGFYGPNSGKNNPNNCAAGYYPSVAALDSLYSKYPGRTIKTAQGWPINHSYWSGSAGTRFSTSKPNLYYTVDLDDDAHREIANSSSNDMQYQVCATTPQALAAQITLTSTLATNSDTQAVKVKNSESIPLIVTTLDAAGNPAPYTAFTLKRDAGTARKTTYKFSGAINTVLTPASGSPQSLSSDTNTLYGATGADGTLALELTEADGPGVKNVLTAGLYDSPSTTSLLAVIFTALTSPDSSEANMWGHMAETFTASNGAEFQRPRLRYEEGTSSNTSYILANNEAWLSLKASSVMSQGIGACGLNQMPLLADLASLYADHPNGKLETDLGMPLTTTSSTRWWSGDPILINQSINYQYYDMKSGRSGYNAGNENYLQICLTTARQTNISLSSTSWDESKSAFVAKKGEAMPVTVTVTDATGKAQANTVVLLTRALSYSRDNKSSSGSLGSMSLTPVLPSGTVVTLMNSGAKWYGTTGDDGTLQLALNQDNSSGLKTAITVSQATDSMIKASNDVIFTVLSSPDSPYAANWGHMPETVTGSDDLLYQRPRLQAEAPSSVGSAIWNGEKWAAVDGSQTYTAGKSVCDVEYMPMMADLNALYQRYPEGELEKQFGWPVTSGKIWWSADLNTVQAHQGINLQTGKVSAPVGNSSGLQICLVNARDVPGSITLTSTAMDVEKDAAVVKKGEAIPLQVMVKDHLGNPMPNAPFTLSRADAKSRTGIIYTSNGADDLSLQALSPSASTTSMTSTGAMFSGVTGIDGMATFTVRQDASVGLDTALTAIATDDVTLSTNATLNVMFTVITSPDSSYARYWGHMPDTLTVDGITLHRPLLPGEAPGVTDTTIDNNEEWATVYSKADGLYFDMSKNCGGVANFPEQSLLEKIRDEQIALTNGWPVTLRSYVSSTPAKYNYCRVSLLEGRDTVCPTVSSDYQPGYAACIIQP